MSTGRKLFFGMGQSTTVGESRTRQEQPLGHRANPIRICIDFHSDIRANVGLRNRCGDVKGGREGRRDGEGVRWDWHNATRNTITAGARLMVTGSQRLGGYLDVCLLALDANPALDGRPDTNRVYWSTRRIECGKRRDALRMDAMKMGGHLNSRRQSC